ncbi:MAG TPA: hypothetical protein VGC56_00670 [Allosphingosinicella sp.]
MSFTVMLFDGGTAILEDYALWTRDSSSWWLARDSIIALRLSDRGPVPMTIVPWNSAEEKLQGYKLAAGIVRERLWPKPAR